MKVALAQIEVVPCRPDINFQKMVSFIVDAKKAKADLIIFPELCLSGYLIGDTWEEQSFVNDCLSYGEDIRNLSDNIIIVFGNVSINKYEKNTDGRMKKYNSLYCAKNRQFTYIYNKTLLPNYREFEELRHFTPALNTFIPFKINDVKIGMCICEDGWDRDYQISPIKLYVENEAELIINISASPFTIGKNGSRNKVFGEGHAKGNNVPLIYVNAVGVQNNGKNIFTFDGSSVAYNKNGEIIVQAPMFKESLDFINYENKDKNLLSIYSHNELIKIEDQLTEIEEIELALFYGTHKFLKACNVNKVVIGLSGGIDSAVTAVIYTKVLGSENVLLVNMPSQYNSSTTINISEKIADNLGCFYTSIGIEESVKLTEKQIQGLEVKNKLGKSITLNLSSFNLENVQARDRSSRILSALSSAWGGVFPNNGNKAEITVGYCTLYGDVAGFLATLGDLWKEQIYELGRHLNKSYYQDLLPEEVFNIVASAELSNDQNIDEGKGDPLIYWYHDRLFQSWMQWWFRSTPEDNLEWYLDKSINYRLNIPKDKNVYDIFPTVKEFTDDLEKWYKLFKGMGVAKRVQSPPILSISRRAYGFDYRETLFGGYLTKRYYELKGKI